MYKVILNIWRVMYRSNITESVSFFDQSEEEKKNDGDIDRTEMILGLSHNYTLRGPYGE